MEEKKQWGSTLIIILLFLVIAGMGYYLFNTMKENDEYNNQIKLLEKENKDLKEVETKKEAENKDIVQNDTKVEKTEEMNIELAYGILNKYKTEKLPNADWYIGKVQLIAHGDNDTYWVTYEEINGDTTTSLATIIKKENGKWTSDLPGSSGFTEEDIVNYNFVKY